MAKKEEDKYIKTAGEDICDGKGEEDKDSLDINITLTRFRGGGHILRERGTERKY